ncbi:MAG TPA: hypothetical protein VF988_12650 [Verrucomicrobiae bacterium]
MNRSILIVICDFLLLSLLTFSTDINRIASDETQRSARTDIVTNAVVEPGRDLNALMQKALASERQSREQLQQQLASATNARVQQQAQLEASQAEYARLKQQYASAQASAEQLNQQLQQQTTQARTAQQMAATSQAEAQKQANVASNLQAQLDRLARSNQLAQAEQQRLANELEMTAAERQAATERAALLQQQAQAAQAENIKLAEGFKTLATNSTALTQEIRENRAIAPNTIFSEFVSNRVQAVIKAARSGFLGIDASKSRQTETILATDGKNIFALCHVDDTPFRLWDPGTDWDGLSGTFHGHGASVPIHSLAFDRRDPRVVMIPVSSDDAKRLGSKVYPISAAPYKFQDAVLIGADQGYYGECDFQLELDSAQYVRLDRNFIKGLFGKFNPSRGDMVFSRQGELLGIMVNGTYCLMIQNYSPAATFGFAEDVRQQHTGTTLSKLYDRVFQMPLRLQ